MSKLASRLSAVLVFLGMTVQLAATTPCLIDFEETCYDVINFPGPSPWLTRVCGEMPCGDNLRINPPVNSIRTIENGEEGRRVPVALNPCTLTWDVYWCGGITGDRCATRRPPPQQSANGQPMTIGGTACGGSGL